LSRNGSGTYSKVNTFVAGATITAASHNANWDDIASEMTNSVAVDGQSTMTGPLKAASGTVAAPGITFGSDLDSGLYRIGSNNIGIAVNGTKVADVATTGASFTGDVNATGTFKIDDVAVFPVPTAQIDDNAVTYAKIVEVAASRLLGNPTGGATEVSEISLGAGLEFSSTTVKAVSVVPTIQRFLSGTAATYTTPANVKWIRIRMVGGGGGGGEGGNTALSAAGGASTFSGGSLSAGGGGAASNSTAGGAGGTPANGNVISIPGGSGGGSNGATNGVGGNGGNSYFGGGGGGGQGGTQPGLGGSTNTGGGGGGGSLSTSSAAGGGAGAYIEHIISAPAASYTYTVGAGGAGMSGGGAGGGDGGAGAAGIIIVEEHY
jgi:hypothetical protein